MGLLRERATCPTPSLNLRFELHPSWNNIHNTFPSETAQGTTKARITSFQNSLWLHILSKSVCKPGLSYMVHNAAVLLNFVPTVQICHLAVLVEAELLLQMSLKYPKFCPDNSPRRPLCVLFLSIHRTVTRKLATYLQIDVTFATRASAD